MFSNGQRSDIISSSQSIVGLDDIEYCESQNLEMLGGFLMIFRNQRRITINARLSDQAKAYGRDHLLQYLTKVADAPAAMYLWVCDEGDIAPST